MRTPEEIEADAAHAQPTLGNAQTMVALIRESRRAGREEMRERAALMAENVGAYEGAGDTIRALPLDEATP